MKRTLITAAILVLVSLAMAAKAPKNAMTSAPAEHRVMTCNIRITGLEADEKPGLRWDDRRDVCLGVILSRKPDIICMQEVIYDSYAYMKEKLTGYMTFGFEGPEMDPYTEGYHLIGKNVIFFSKKRYELVSEGCYWLSDTPQIGGSVSWDSARARHANWVRLRDRRTGHEFRVLDVHLDHISEEARQAQAKMIVEECAQYQEDFPQIMCGDFNSGIANIAIKAVKEAGWRDAYEAIYGEEETGYTCHAWKGADRGKKGRRIDFIFFRGGVEASSAEIIKDCPRGIWPSDHYFLWSTLKF